MSRMPRKRRKLATRGRDAPAASPAAAPRDVAPRDVGGGIAAGDSLEIFCFVSDPAFGATADDVVALHSIEFRYTAAL